MRWYRFGLLMAKARILLAGITVELTAHWLSVSYALGLLVLLFMVCGMQLNTGLIKAQAAHQRIDVLVPQVGAIGTTANNALPKSGGTVTGNLTVNGSHSVGGSVSSGSTITSAGDVIVGGTVSSPGGTLTTNGNHAVTGKFSANASGSSAQMAIGGNGHITGGLEVDGSLVTSTGGSIPQAAPSTAGSYTGGSPSGTGNLAAWAASVTTVVNDIRAQLLLAGVLS